MILIGKRPSPPRRRFARSRRGHRCRARPSRRRRRPQTRRSRRTSPGQQRFVSPRPPPTVAPRLPSPARRRTPRRRHGRHQEGGRRSRYRSRDDGILFKIFTLTKQSNGDHPSTLSFLHNIPYLQHQSTRVGIGANSGRKKPSAQCESFKIFVYLIFNVE